MITGRGDIGVLYLNWSDIRFAGLAKTFLSGHLSHSFSIKFLENLYCDLYRHHDINHIMREEFYPYLKVLSDAYELLFTSQFATLEDQLVNQNSSVHQNSCVCLLLVLSPCMLQLPPLLPLFCFRY